MNIYRKYRPQTFDEVIGNEAQVEAFKNTLSKESRPHTYLISGPSGCGKTTLARIAAKQLGADELSITEINTSENRGIDTARDLIDQMAYQPVGGSCRVFIIDECHATTKDWQNAMLKPLEDTPNHVYFFLCTTDPGKMLKAIQTRCTTITVNTLDTETLYRLLRRTAKKENLEFSKEILQHIAENSDGSPRMSLVLLEKIIGMSDEKRMREVITLGENASAVTIDLCRALLKKQSWDAIAGILKGLKDEEPERVRQAVLGYMNSVMLSSRNHTAACIMEIFSENFYNTGKSGLTLACYQSVFSDDRE